MVLARITAAGWLGVMLINAASLLGNLGVLWDLLRGVLGHSQQAC